MLFSFIKWFLTSLLKDTNKLNEADEMVCSPLKIDDFNALIQVTPHWNYNNESLKIAFGTDLNFISPKISNAFYAYSYIQKYIK